MACQHYSVDNRSGEYIIMNELIVLVAHHKLLVANIKYGQFSGYAYSGVGHASPTLIITLNYIIFLRLLSILMRQYSCRVWCSDRVCDSLINSQAYYWRHIIEK
jgi:hypothetical protein